MKSLEPIVSVEKSSQLLLNEAQQQARDIQLQAERSKQELLKTWSAQEKQLDADLYEAQEKKRQSLEKKVLEKDAELFAQLQGQIKKNQNKTKKIFFELMR